MQHQCRSFDHFGLESYGRTAKTSISTVGTNGGGGQLIRDYDGQIVQSSSLSGQDKRTHLISETGNWNMSRFNSEDFMKQMNKTLSAAQIAHRVPLTHPTIQKPKSITTPSAINIGTSERFTSQFGMQRGTPQNLVIPGGFMWH